MRLWNADDLKKEESKKLNAFRRSQLQISKDTQKV